MSALQKFTYGMFLLTAQEAGKDNGCVVNTVMQVSSQPARVAVCMFKKNLTHDMVLRTGLFNLCCFSTDAEFELFRRFGMQSGRKIDKFQDLTSLERGRNGLYLLTQGVNSSLCARVTDSVDLDDHTLFIAEVTESHIISQVPSCTFDDYQTHISSHKNIPSALRWVCRSVTSSKINSPFSRGTGTFRFPYLLSFRNYLRKQGVSESPYNPVMFEREARVIELLISEGFLD